MTADQFTSEIDALAERLAVAGIVPDHLRCPCGQGHWLGKCPIVITAAAAWTRLGLGGRDDPAGSKTVKALARRGIGPDEVRRLSKRDLLSIRNFGKWGMARIQGLLAASETAVETAVIQERLARYVGLEKP